MNTEIDRNGAEVAIFTVENSFDTYELMEKIQFGYERSAKRDSTFLAVIDARQTMYVSSVTANVHFLNQFIDLVNLPRKSPEFRIAIIAKYDSTLYDSVGGALFEDQKLKKPETTGDWISTLLAVGFTALDVGTSFKEMASHPVANHPWIQIRSSLTEGIEWCRQNAVW